MLGLKAVLLGYWLWAAWAWLTPDRDAFDALVALAAPMLFTLHFVQGLMFMRLFPRRPKWGADFAQILVFGMVHLFPILTNARKRKPGATGGRP